MYLACSWVDERWQDIYIGAQQFADSPIVEYLSYDRMLMRNAEQHFFGSDILSVFCLLCFIIEFEFIEQEFPYLSWGIDIEVGTSGLPYLVFYLLQLFIESFGSLSEYCSIEAHACLFHACEYGCERHLYISE